jgi:hypothetical protein
MNTTILNYPGFQTLPKEIKQLLVASEAQYFDQPASFHRNQRENGSAQLFGQTAREVLAFSGDREWSQRKTELLLDVLHWASAHAAEAKSELGKSAYELIDLIKMIEQKLCPKLE